MHLAVDVVESLLGVEDVRNAGDLDPSSASEQNLRT